MLILTKPPQVLELHSGDRMTQKEFHRVYERMPKNFRAELIGGTVYVASPVKAQHGTTQFHLVGLLLPYLAATPGVDGGDNTTTILAQDSETQPDVYLRILPEFGGQSQTTPNDYIGGPPEWIAEVAVSSRSYDLHQKHDDYLRYGVLEYLVICPAQKAVHWFDLRSDQELEVPTDGIVRSRVFPGLWINTAALLKKESGKLIKTLYQGLATPEHAIFVKRLATAHEAMQSKKRQPRNGQNRARRPRRPGAGR